MALALAGDGLARGLGLAPEAAEAPLLARDVAERGEGLDALELVRELRAKELVQEELVDDEARPLDVQDTALRARLPRRRLDPVRSYSWHVRAHRKSARLGLRYQSVYTLSVKEHELRC